MLFLVLSRLDSFLSLFAATSQTDCNNSKNGTFFGLPTWYKYLEVEYIQAGASGDGVCKFLITDASGDLEVIKLGLIGLAIVDILLRVVGIVAVGYIIWGGIKYITSQGQPENTKNALNTIINACVGLAIAMVAAALVGFIGNRLG